MSDKEIIQKIQSIIEESDIKEGDYLKISNFLNKIYKKNDESNYDSEYEGSRRTLPSISPLANLPANLTNILPGLASIIRTTPAPIPISTRDLPVGNRRTL